MVFLFLSIVPISDLNENSSVASAAESLTEGYYTYAVTNGKAEITDVDTAISGNITLPDTLGGFPVTSIGNSAFYNCSNLTNISISGSVISIGYSAFARCSSLVDITIPDSVTSIDGGAFSDCISLTNITIPDSVTCVGSYVFTNTAYYNTESNWENGVLYVGNHLVNGKSDNISGEYTIKPETKTVAGSVFYSCINLTGIKFPDSVTSIEVSAFSACSSLTDVYYSGKAEQWQQITIEEYNTDLLNATIHYAEPEQPDVSFEDSEDAKVLGSDVLVNAGFGTVELLSQAGEGAKILDKDGHELPVDKLPCTGMTLKLSYGTKYTIVVLGDADCDGNVSSSDARLALRASVGLEKYEEISPEFKAANVERGDGLSSADAQLILRASVGLEDTKAWLR